MIVGWAFFVRLVVRIVDDVRRGILVGRTRVWDVKARRHGSGKAAGAVR